MRMSGQLHTIFDNISTK